MTKQWLICENVVHLITNHVIYFILKNIKNWVWNKDPGSSMLFGARGAHGADFINCRWSKFGLQRADS